jgi:hypothetical protein
VEVQSIKRPAPATPETARAEVQTGKLLKHEEERGAGAGLFSDLTGFGRDLLPPTGSVGTGAVPGKPKPRANRTGCEFELTSSTPPERCLEPEKSAGLFHVPEQNSRIFPAPP